MSNKGEISLQIPANHQYLNLIGACLQALFERYESLSNQTELLYSLQLGIHEVCTNIVDHAYQGKYEGIIEVVFDVSLLPDSIQITLSDTGLSFHPDSIPLPDLGFPQVHGYGLFLAHELLDEIIYEPKDGGNIWYIRKKLK